MACLNQYSTIVFREKYGKKPGPSQLSAAEEEFSSFLIEVSQAGYGRKLGVLHIWLLLIKGKGVGPLYQTGDFKDLCKSNHIYHTEGEILQQMSK